MPKCANIERMAQVQARIVVAQAGNPADGDYVSGSRDLLLQGATITLTNLNNTSVSSHEWSFDFPPNRTASDYTITGQTGPTCTITPLPDPRGFGDIKVKLIVTGPPVGGKRNVSVDEIILGIPKPMEGYDAGFPVPHPKEGGAGTRATLNASTGAMGRVSQFAMAALQYLGGTADNYPRPVQVAVYADSNVDVHGGPTTIQSYSCVEGTVVWLDGQSDVTEDGLWIVVADDWIRHPALDSSEDVSNGLVFQVVYGTYTEKSYIVVWDDPSGGKTLGTDEFKAIEITGGAGGTPVGATGTVLAGTGASSAFTSTPTLTGLTLTGFSGIVRASAGAFAAGWYVPDQTNPASTGFIRMSNASAIMARNNTNSADWTLLTTDTKIKFGSTTGPAVSILSSANVAIGDSTIWATVDSTGITLEGNSATALYGGDNAGSPFSLIAGIDADVWIGDNVGSVIVNIPDASFFTITNNGVQTCRFTSDGGESFQEFTDAQPATIRVNTNTSGNGANLGIYAGSSGGSNGNGGDLIHAAGEKNGSGTHGDYIVYAGGQQRVLVKYGKSEWQRFGPLWILELDLSLIANSGASSEISVANPADYFVISSHWSMRLSTAITGGTSTITGGNSSGGVELIASTAWTSGTSANTKKHGGPSGTESAAGSGYNADYDGYVYTAATTLYFKAAASVSNVTAGNAKIKLYGREL